MQAGQTGSLHAPKAHSLTSRAESLSEQVSPHIYYYRDRLVRIEEPDQQIEPGIAGDCPCQGRLPGRGTPREFRQTNPVQTFLRVPLLPKELRDRLGRFYCKFHLANQLVSCPEWHC